jgi:hypothetical protein
MKDLDLYRLNQSGWIPGPKESEEEFLQRVERSKRRFERGEWIPDAHWQWVREFLGKMFDVKPLYICAFYSNRSLAPWQGAASWIEGRDLCSVQMRTQLKKGSYLGLYRREEILAHEAIHAARSGFDEGRFEEFFAYMASEKKWRRILGPIVRRPWEVWPLFLFMVGGIFFPLCYLGVMGWMSAGFVRLIRGHFVLRKASEALLGKVRDESKVRAILFRMTDLEIESLAKGKSLCELAQNDLRWKVIQCYLE